MTETDARIIQAERFTLRPYRADDAAALAEVAGAFEVSRWMTARFPYPYTLDDAHRWLAVATAQDPTENFALEVDGALAGGIGIEAQAGELRGTAEFGYWLGRAYWGRGLATEAARLLVNHALGERGLRRLQAHVFAPNAASVRVLEKTGFRREGILRSAYVERDGTVVDGFLYARLASDAVS